MRTFWARALIVALIFSGLFALLAGNLSSNDDHGQRGQALAALFDLVRTYFVEPLGLPLAAASVGASVLAVAGFLALGKQPIEPSSLGHGESDATGPRPLPAVSPTGGFGRRKAMPEQGAPPRNEHGRLTLDVLRTRSFDWYFAHHGFEGRWKTAHAELLGLGEHDRAALLMEAGALHDRFIEEVFTPQQGEPSAEEERAYLEAMRMIDRRYKSIPPS